MDHTIVECHVFIVDHYCNLRIGLIILFNMPMSSVMWLHSWSTF